MRPVHALPVLVLILAAACGDAPTAADAPTRALRVAAEQPTQLVDVHVLLDGGSVATLAALHHASHNNEWVSFGARPQPAGVSVAGPGRVQFAAGVTRAGGVLTIGAPLGMVVVDLAQFDGSLVSPFAPNAIGPGGGCIVARATVYPAQQGVPYEIEMELEWGPAQAP